MKNKSTSQLFCLNKQTLILIILLIGIFLFIIVSYALRNNRIIVKSQAQSATPIPPPPTYRPLQTQVPPQLSIYYSTPQVSPKPSVSIKQIPTLHLFLALYYDYMSYITRVTLDKKIDFNTYRITPWEYYLRFAPSDSSYGGVRIIDNKTGRVFWKRIIHISTFGPLSFQEIQSEIQARSKNDLDNLYKKITSLDLKKTSLQNFISGLTQNEKDLLKILSMSVWYTPYGTPLNCQQLYHALFMHATRGTFSIEQIKKILNISDPISRDIVEKLLVSMFSLPGDFDLSSHVVVFDDRSVLPAADILKKLDEKCKGRYKVEWGKGKDGCEIWIIDKDAVRSLGKNPDALFSMTGVSSAFVTGLKQGSQNLYFGGSGYLLFGLPNPLHYLLFAFP